MSALRTVLMVGPSRDAQGGIATVLRRYAASSLSGQYAVEWVATTSGVDRVRDARAFVAALARVRSVCQSSPMPVLLHIHTASRGSFVRKSMIAELGRRMGAVVVLHVHGGGFAHFADTSPRSLRARIVSTLEMADIVLALSPRWAESIRAIAAEANVVVLPNPVDIPPLREEAREGGLFAGRLSVEKGVVDLVKAIGILQRRGIKSRWVLGGDKPDDALEDALRTLPQPESVMNAGWVDSAELDRLMWESSIYCLPSHAEGSPMALLEAMARQMACVVSDVGGIPDIVTDGVDALVVPTGHPDSLAAALELLLLDGGLARRLGEAARQRVSREHETEMVMSRLREIYASVGVCGKGA